MSCCSTHVEPGVEWLTVISVQDICNLKSKVTENTVRGLFCLHGSWNTDLESALSILKQWRPSVNNPNRKFVTGMVQVDESDESMATLCGDDGCLLPLLDGNHSLPNELPALLAVVQDASKSRAYVQVVQGVASRDILYEGPSPRILNLVKATFNALILGVTPASDRKRQITPPPTPVHKEALRIFVAGDRANVGKTSVCLGLLGSLIATGYQPSDIAYIKPATQDESKQLLQVYCEKVGIQCVPIGPIVFYRGFTRAFLAGEAAESSAQMLDRVAASVNELAAGKRVIVIDGVGYPAVGSICGVDNASVAIACGYAEDVPLGVVLVSPSGVGHAVDSFNLNANYFESQHVPVMGAIFNKLAIDGYYSLKNCRDQVTSYFQQYRPTSKAFGFLPVFPHLGGDDAMDHLDDFFRTFAENVDVDSLLETARRIQKTRSSPAAVIPTPMKRAKISHTTTNSMQRDVPIRPMSNGHHSVLSRQQIEEQAAAAGAQTSC